MSKYTNNYECPNCFCLWYVESEDFTLGTVPNLCDYCKDKMPMTEIERIDRYISIITDTYTDKLPIMLPLIWKVIKEIKEKNNEIL